MKRNIVSIMIMFLMISTNLFGALPKAQDIAKEVLKAYKTKDVELLKKNASGIMVNAISESYFGDKSIQKDMEVVQSWDGKIKEVRYGVENMMGAKVTMAMVYYADATDAEEIYVVLLSTMDNEKWVFVGSGLSTEKKENFIKLHKTIADAGKKEVAKKKVNKVFNLEMFSGDSFKKVSEEKMIECFNTLNDDNFFVELFCKDDGIQVAYSADGYTFSGSEGGKDFSSKEMLSKEDTIQFLKDYYNGSDDWKSKAVFDK